MAEVYLKGNSILMTINSATQFRFNKFNEKKICTPMYQLEKDHGLWMDLNMLNHCRASFRRVIISQLYKTAPKLSYRLLYPDIQIDI